MTATIAPESGPRSRDGFAPRLYAEWTKFRTVRGWVIAMVVAALLIAGFGIWASSGGQACGTMMPGGQIVAQRCPGPPLGPGREAVTDSFYFVRQPLRGDGSLTVRVTALVGGTSSDNPDGPFTAGLQPWAKAGIIVAASLRPGSAYAAMLVTGGHGVRMQDDYTGDAAGPGGAVSAASPRWLRLVRSGDMLNGYESADGTHWIRVGTARLAGLPSVVPAGLFVTSPDSVTAESSSPTLATAVFDHVVMSGAGPRGAWRGGPVGAAGAPSDTPGGRFRLADGQFTVSGAGDIAPAVANSSWSGKPADHALTGAFAGLIVVIVVGTMFMTAEYRRGLIRTTLAASPRRGQVLAAKAIVAGSAAFAAALPGAAPGSGAASGVDQAAHRGQHGLAAAGRRGGHRGGERRGGRGRRLHLLRRLPSGRRQAHPDRHRRRPGDGGHHGRDRGHRRVPHRHDPRHAGRGPAADRGAGRQGHCRHRPDPGRRGGRRPGFGAGRAAAPARTRAHLARRADAARRRGIGALPGPDRAAAWAWPPRCETPRRPSGWSSGCCTSSRSSAWRPAPAGSGTFSRSGR
jgi:hypothetical protein